MSPRGTRLACSLRTQDDCHGAYDAYPGEQRGLIGKVEPVRWDKPPKMPVIEGAFTVIGDMGMTGQVILINQQQWKALGDAKLEAYFYAAILWGKNPFKVIEDALLMLKRGA